jgi:2-octaprenyl-6-methoxyphenol hydroxylase
MRAEIEIRGAGPVGRILALALSRLGRPVVLVENRRSPSSFRPIALSHASRLILERVGAWDGLAVTPIETIHVSQQGGFGRARLEAAEAGVPALGYVTDYAVLLGHLGSLTAAIPSASGQSQASLVVHAEGSSEEMTERSYGQEAVVALVTAAPAAGRTAFERFTAEGPLGLLPLEGRYGAVWAMAPARAQALAEAPAPQFLEALRSTLGERAGRLCEVAERGRVPLALRVRRSRVGVREVFIGNAAQSLHPVAGQGLNLGLRDAWDLAQVLRDAADPGDERVLARFAAQRRYDALATVRLTDLLASGFAGASAPGRLARGLGLTALDSCPPARRFFARRMIFGASAIP